MNMLLSGEIYGSGGSVWSVAAMPGEPTWYLVLDGICFPKHASILNLPRRFCSKLCCCPLTMTSSQAKVLPISLTYTMLSNTDMQAQHNIFLNLSRMLLL